MVSHTSVVMALLSAVFLLSLVSSAFADDLKYNYYDGKCENFEHVVAGVVRKAYKKDPSIAPSLLRLHFHDCAVRGCDASILLDYPGSEMKAKASKTLRGYEVIDEIKKKLNDKCQRVVSCADILTAAARDATYIVGGPFWSNEYGRKDGMVSIAAEAEDTPGGHDDVTSLIEFYQSIGLTTLDLVVLSGSHTIGRSSCASVQNRLYNYYGTGRPDPSLSPKYLNYLRRKCSNQTAYVDLDATTPTTFDNKYYSNLLKNMGLLYTDQILYGDHRTTHLVRTLASQPQNFPYMFAASMVKMGGIMGDAEDDGEIRLQCSRINADTHRTSKHNHGSSEHYHGSSKHY